MKKLGILILLFPLLCVAEDAVIKIGWIGSITGPCASYGAHQAALLAEEDIKKEKGINLKVYYEDSHCDGKAAVTAFQKLVDIEGVKFIVGGHSSPETTAIVPLADKRKIALLAAISSNPKLTSASSYFSRLTPILLENSVQLATAILKNSEIKKIGILYEETDYVLPLADKLKDELLKGKVEAISMNFASSEIDFRTMLTKLISKGINAIYIGVQSKDKANLILKQMSELKINVPLYGTVQAAMEFKDKYRDQLKTTFTYADTVFDLKADKTAKFIENFSKRYKTEGLPLGIWTAEAYDALYLMADAVKRCGDDTAKVSECIRQTKNYPGVSGTVSIAENGDGIRGFETMVINATQ